MFVWLLTVYIIWKQAKKVEWEVLVQQVYRLNVGKNMLQYTLNKC